MSSLHSIGLTEDQILTYQCLLENGSLTPPQLSQLTEESRTSAYMSLKKLEELGLAERDATSNKLVYNAISPAELERLLHEQEQVIQAARGELQAQLPAMLNMYYNNTTRPAVQFYEGPDTLEHIYQDQIETGEDVYCIQSPANKKQPKDTLYDYIYQRAEAGITAYGLAPAIPSLVTWAEKNDTQLRRNMTWFNPEQYTAPVEIAIYGSKIVYVSFGKQLTATIINNPQIADAMRQVYALAQVGAQAAKAPGKTSKLSRVVKTAADRKPASTRSKRKTDSSKVDTKPAKTKAAAAKSTKAQSGSKSTKTTTTAKKNGSKK